MTVSTDLRAGFDLEDYATTSGGGTTSGGQQPGG